MESQQTAEWERALRRGALAGDEAAWRMLYDRSYNPLCVYVFHRCGRDRQETEEVVQECWLIAVRRLRRFDPDRGSFLMWIVGIARNVLRNRWRRRARRRREAGAFPEAEASSSAVHPDRELDLAEQVAMAMAALPDRYRAALRAKYEEQLSVREIAGRWEESAKAVESLLSRARTAFRRVYGSLAR